MPLAFLAFSSALFALSPVVLAGWMGREKGAAGRAGWLQAVSAGLGFVALLIIGATLAQMKVSEMFGNVYAYVITAVNILISPAITYALFHPFLTDPMALRIAVIMDAMPVATTGTMLCVDLGGDEKFMAQMTFISTAATVFTIPIIAMLLA